MAIVFISPKQKQGMFFWGITLSLVLFLLVVSFFVFFPEFINQPQSIPLQPSAIDASLAINFAVVDSDQVKKLEPFTVIELAFSYVVTDKNGRKITGTISAGTKDAAQKLLEAAGYKVSSLEEIKAGRSNPFVAY